MHAALSELPPTAADARVALGAVGNCEPIEPLAERPIFGRDRFGQRDQRSVRPLVQHLENAIRPINKLVHERVI